MEVIRRNFIRGMALGSAGMGAAAAARGQERTVTYRVKGFTCPTCAAGLDTMLGREKGVMQAHSKYPEGITAIRFDASLVSEKELRAFIAELGFTAEEERGHE